MPTLQFVDASSQTITLLTEWLPFVLIFFGLRKKLDTVQWLLAIAVLPLEIIGPINISAAAGRRFTHETITDLIGQSEFHILNLHIFLLDLCNVVVIIALSMALYQFSIRAFRRQTAIAQELANARAIQHILIPDEIPPTPGFLIQSIYTPFGEVGGDFFQVLPQADNSILIAIGDVSGKGMPAAMTVSLLVGTLRTLAHYTQSLGEILASMNARMLGRSSRGFTTCLIVRADPDGNLTVANAGHISPYLGGKKIELANGLPLGLAADATYSESSHHLGIDTQLTLVTDGVVEAREKSGELFGFERTAVIAHHSAETIASTARTFGQDDDITVLTILRKSFDPSASIRSTDFALAT